MGTEWRHVVYRINRPGGCGKIVKVNVQDDQVRLDVKYILGGFDKELDPCLIEVPESLGTRERKRRTILTVEATKDTTKRSKQTVARGSAPISKENAGNHIVTPAAVSAATKVDPNSQKKKNKNVKSKQGKNTKKAKSGAVEDKKERPIDIPSEITIQRPVFASPMTVKGAEEGRKYMLPNNHSRRASPSSLFMQSHLGDTDVSPSDNNLKEDDPLSDANSVAASSASEKSDKDVIKVKDDDESAAAASPLPEAPTRRVTMKSVVDREMKQASTFVDEVLNTKPGEIKKEVRKPKEPTEETLRQQELMSAFMQLMDHNESSVDEDSLVELIKQQSGKGQDFCEDEIQALIEKLDDSGKIMRCDGIIFRV